MRWLNRSVVLCLLIVVLTPARADAWFEWLDYLSGPGPWYGLKADVRLLCFGQEMPFKRLNEVMLSATKTSGKAVATLEREWREVLEIIRGMDAGLHVLNQRELDQLDTTVNNLISAAGKNNIQAMDASVAALSPMVVQAQTTLRKASVAIASTGIFISLCSPDTRKSLALEGGFTWMGSRNPDFANNEFIGLMTFTGGLSYRVPLPASRDFIDFGTNVGKYRFYSDGFPAFSGWTIEPYTDIHLPTKYVLSDFKVERFLARFSLRAGLVFFPGGFKAEQFASGPSKTDISGREATTSLTVFFRLRP